MCFHKKQITCITARNLITNQDYIDVGFSNVSQVAEVSIKAVLLLVSFQETKNLSAAIATCDQ